jgi:hypothetical protein
VVGREKVIEQKLLPAPKRENISGLNFDPRKEPVYLSQFFGELRKRQLETEISTALSELLLSEYSHDYIWDGERIVDQETGIVAENLIKNSEFESQRLEEIKGKFRKGKDLVVSVSPKNKELDYPDDIVDFWKRGEGNKLTLLRFKVEMTVGELRDFELMDKRDYKLADLIRMLSLAESKQGLSIRTIETTTRSLVKRFEKEFGERIFVDAELIIRLFVAARLEVEKQKDEEIVLTRAAEKLNMERIENYLYGELKIKTVAGGGCGGSSLSGEFGNGQGIIIVVTADGISFRKGSTEGLTYCKKCGCWYSGEKCPICG